MKQLTLPDVDDPSHISENENFLTQQLITYLGNKRSLLGFIGSGMLDIQKRLGKRTLRIFDVFSGSGVVSRYFKRFASSLYVNDYERYAEVINECYLANRSDIDFGLLASAHSDIIRQLSEKKLESGFITQLYSPRDDANIQLGERVFYTRRNAQYIDTARRLIERSDAANRNFLLAPLLSEASIHANTSGVFKGFYKNRDTGVGEYGGRNGDAIFRIKGNINLPFPVFSNYECEIGVYRGDSNEIVDDVPEVDVAYLDPPYNQHPYGSNYFMLNLISEYQEPTSTSDVSGIPDDWNRSSYNKPQKAAAALRDLIEKVKAKYLIISFNSEGFIGLDEMVEMLEKIGKVKVLETKYATFRGSRNLNDRNIHVKEYLYLVEKK